MTIKGPDLVIGRHSEQPDPYFTCPNCDGHNGVHHFIFMGHLADGPWSTRCTDCGYCDRCKRADA